ncbi:MAG: hypothetical protein IKZ44_09970 [Clostridia bacterium]|nr:hypothetical protein [Clostridia bacterium]
MLTKQDRFFAYGGAERMPHRERDASRTAGELLLRFGITPHLCGFEPLCEGVRIVAERERERERPPLVELQPAVARLLGEQSQEHAMRDAIGVGFLGPDEIHARLFPFSDRPGSAEFICTLAELVCDRITQQ